jgi:hypothetical protein
MCSLHLLCWASVPANPLGILLGQPCMTERLAPRTTVRD